ncbi:hypothetical protein SlGVgp105 [Spodoptera litura granulovirus]|uniref:Uncharacterized protein n=1 Tax=Spodoptera litura granulovirus TaxID=359919 RepID=A5IZV7_9BBAC|nr:hypothetical protein SlGVgp105 [Spodoptera litura granulovirus]ABQ52048.1 hypothetical protein SlGVgp105 [Spodoptera litura granulovirus]
MDLKHKQIIKIVSIALEGHNKGVDKDKVIDKLHKEYRISSKKESGRCLDIMVNLFRLMTIKDECLLRMILREHFYKNNKVVNYAYFVNHIPFTLIDEDCTVIRSYYSVGMKKWCVQCNNNDVSVKLFEDTVSVKPEESYWFVCSNICDMCFTNKLYKQI